MKFMILTFVAAAGLCVTANAMPTDAAVEIEKQRLVKFPEDVDQQLPDRPENDTATNDEAKRILEEIAKINQALGYVKKQPEQPKIPPILDSSQYLFPQPAFHPFHSQNHQIAGNNGETILIPSIRSFDFGIAPKATDLSAYNAPPRKPTKPNKPAHAAQTQRTHSNALADTNTPKQQLMSLNEYQAYLKRQQTQSQLANAKPATSQKPQFFFRPNQVVLPAPQGDREEQQLPAHFVIPVRLYKLNKEEYLQKYAPQEYRVKGYKIVGDIDNFYGKAKSKAKPGQAGQSGTTQSAKSKSTPKYHLFFLPHELVHATNATTLRPQQQQQPASPTRSVLPQPTSDDGNGSREEKLANRPFKIQTTASTSSQNSAGSMNSSTTTQIVRKRIVPKPLRDRETNVAAVAGQQVPGVGTASTANAIHITPPPPSPPSAADSPNNFVLLNNNNNNNNPSTTDGDSQASPTSTPHANPSPSGATNAIKTAFQNIFKFPFRPELRPKPETATESATNLQAVPLQTPQKTIFATQQMLPQPFYQAPMANSADYRWDEDNSNSDSLPDDDDFADGDDVREQAEQKIFGHHHAQQLATQKEAIKQGGIIIQKLKVRKGGIAIAGPGGVATAGSGGTAIVGPGGYALTHPRSLTIAGPGAKIIAIPANVDLKDALLRTDLLAQTFPREGKIVATGPTVYYSPATAEMAVAVDL